MTKEQIENALEGFKNWLTHPSELGKEPAEIEVAETFYYEKYKMEYAVVKFKKEKDEDWLFGICGGYAENEIQHSGYIWSEFEKFDDNAKDKCILYLEKLDKMWLDKLKQDLFSKLEDLHKKRDWEEIINQVDKNISIFKQLRERNGAKCYQFKNFPEFMHYVTTHREEACEWVINTEYLLLNRKLYSFIELKRYSEAEQVANQILEICPENVETKLELFEVAKRQGDFAKCEKILKDVYPLIWNFLDYARFIRALAWLCIEMEDVKGAINYLALSLTYDNCQRAYDYVNNELQYIENRFKVATIGKPTMQQLDEHFEGNPYKIPTEQNVHFAYDLYEYCLKNKDRVNQKDIAFAKDNVIMLNQNFPYLAKVVEVNAITPNKLITNWQYGFDFQISKEFKKEDFDGVKFPARLYSLKRGKETITISRSGTFKNEEEYEQKLTQFKNNVKEKNEILFEGSFVGQNQIKASKILQKCPTGDLFVTYWFKFNNNLIGRVSAKVMEDNSALEGEIINIISTWSYLK